jgi:hypothetical protein
LLLVPNSYFVGSSMSGIDKKILDQYAIYNRAEHSTRKGVDYRNIIKQRYAEYKAALPSRKDAILDEIYAELACPFYTSTHPPWTRLNDADAISKIRRSLCNYELERQKKLLEQQQKKKKKKKKAEATQKEEQVAETSVPNPPSATITELALTTEPAPSPPSPNDPSLTTVTINKEYLTMKDTILFPPLPTIFHNCKKSGQTQPKYFDQVDNLLEDGRCYSLEELETMQLYR